MYERLLKFSFLLVLLPALLFSLDGYYRFSDFCLSNGLLPKFDLTEGSVEVSREGKKVTAHLAMPYLVSGNRIHYFPGAFSLGEQGEWWVKSEAAGWISRELLPSPPVSSSRTLASSSVSRGRSSSVSRSSVSSRAVSSARSSIERSSSSSRASSRTTVITASTQVKPINLIIIDPGHGGKDPGGIGQSGVKEKEVVLAIAKKLAALLEQDGRYKVVLTRSSDRYVTLKERTELSSRLQKKGYRPIFVSIHGNISLNRKTEGLELYSLSDKASDDSALFVESAENSGFSRTDVEKTRALFLILSDLMKDAFRIQSDELAKTLGYTLMKSTGVKLQGVKKANFYVLRYNAMPSVLVEVGFLSHAAESERLVSADYQKRLALGLYRGILQYIQSYNESGGFSR